jgi:hypothetical protein
MAEKKEKKVYLRPKKCEDCVLRKLSGEYECVGGFDAKDCIGMLQGVIERIAEQRNFIVNTDDVITASVRVDYVVNGEGSVYISGDPSYDEIAAEIFKDCNEKEFYVEHFGYGGRMNENDRL